MKDTSVGSIARFAHYFLGMLVCAFMAGPPAAAAATATEISRDSNQALQQPDAHEPRTRHLAEKATAILVFPQIVKAGLLVGGQTGSGALIRGSRVQAYAAPFGQKGLMAGIGLEGSKITRIHPK